MLDRLHELGLKSVRLPIEASEQDNHVPILVSHDLSIKSRIILILPERNQDLAISSYRIVGNDGINKGSLVDIVSAILKGEASASGEEIPGIVIANPGQLLWYRGGARAVSRAEWSSLPRESAVHEAMRIDPIRNMIPQNRDHEEHVQYIFEHVLEKMTVCDATIDVIGNEWTSQAMIKYLARNCESTVTASQINPY